MSVALPDPERENRSENGLTAEQMLEVWVMIDGKVEKSENRVVAAIADLKADMRDMKADLKADMNDMKADLKADMNDMKADLKADMNDMKADIRAVNQKVDSLAADVTDVRIDVTGIKSRMLYYALLILVVILLAPDGLQGILESFLTKS